MRMGKSGKTNVLLVITLVAIAVIVFKPDLLDSLTQSATGTATGGNNGGNTGGINIVEDTTLTVHTRDFYTKSTALPGAGVRLLLQNGETTDKGTLANDGSTTVSPSDKIILYGGENSTTYYTLKDAMTIPDKGTKEVTFSLKAMDTSPTLTFFDENDQPNTAQALGADETKTLEIKLKASSKACIGNPDVGGMNVLCMKYNSTTYNSVKLDGATKVSIPQNASTVLSEAGTAVNCYEVEVLCNNAEWRKNVVIETASTQPAAEHDINVTIDDVDYDLNADDLSEIIGVQDEDNNNLGLGTIYLRSIEVS